MEKKAVTTSPQVTRQPRKRGSRPAKTIWKALRTPLKRSRVINILLASVLAQAVRFIYWTNPRVAGSDDPDLAVATVSPAIAAFWHGQHLMAPAIRPKHLRMVALFSRSPDAELNARVAERLGFGVVRGSGGREKVKEKGGARALIALKKALDGGTNVAMIADIPHGEPRQAGMGIVTLAKISGRPIVPLALATSRRKVLDKSWDKTTINLPFGRSALVVGEPIHVSGNADSAAMEEKRQLLTDALNRATEKAYLLVDGAQ